MYVLVSSLMAEAPLISVLSFLRYLDVLVETPHVQLNGALPRGDYRFILAHFVRLLAHFGPVQALVLVRPLGRPRLGPPLGAAQPVSPGGGLVGRQGPVNATLNAGNALSQGVSNGV